MKSYIAYKNQIQGIKNVSETVKIVEKIAASSVHSLKNEVFNLDIYVSKLEEMLINLSSFYQAKNNSLLQKKTVGKKTLIILTSNKGLVGGLWHKIISSFLDQNEHYESIIVIGEKAKHYLQEENITILKSFTKSLNIPQKEEIKDIIDYVFSGFKKGEFSQVDILYPKFISLSEQIPIITSFIPFDFKLIKEKKYKEGLPIFEPSKKIIFDKILQKYIEVFFHKIVMESKLSEFSARTVSMEHASVKINKFIRKLTLDYTKQRRRIVTQGQLESFTAHKMI